jgi:hypothetical protein
LVEDTFLDGGQRVSEIDDLRGLLKAWAAGAIAQVVRTSAKTETSLRRLFRGDFDITEQQLP